MNKKAYTLYHGTIADNKQSIKDFGLEPQVGPWVQEVLSGATDEDIDYDDHGLVFAADKERFGMAVYSMLHHIGRKLNKSASDVTEDEVRSHGLLVMIKDGEEYFEKRPPSSDWPDYDDTWDRRQEEISYETGNPLWAVEPEDWFSLEGAPADILLTGNKLLKYITRRGEYPLKQRLSHGYRKSLMQDYIKQKADPVQRELFPRDISDIKEEAESLGNVELGSLSSNKMLKQLIKIANELDKRGLVNEADLLDKIAAKESFECGEEKCSFFYVGQELDEHDIPEDIDYYEILEGVESLFKKTRIRMFRNEDFYQACVTEGGEVCGASVVGESSDEFYGPTIRFSIAVSEMARRQGMAKELVENIINDFPESRIEAWVVNEEAMVPLLEGLGFDGYGGRSDPIMHLER